MARYYLNRKTQSNGIHEVHKLGCFGMPSEQNRLYLGEHPSCQSAVEAAKEIFIQSNGCYFCANECHI